MIPKKYSKLISMVLVSIVAMLIQIPSVFAVTVRVRNFNGRPTEAQIKRLLFTNTVIGTLGTFEDSAFRGIHSDGAYGAFAIAPDGTNLGRANAHVSVRYSDQSCLACRVDGRHRPRQFEVHDIPEAFFSGGARHFFSFSVPAADFPGFSSLYPGNYRVEVLIELNIGPYPHLRRRGPSGYFYHFAWPGSISSILIMPEPVSDQISDDLEAAMRDYPPVINPEAPSSSDFDLDITFDRFVPPTPPTGSMPPHDRNFLTGNLALTYAGFYFWLQYNCLECFLRILSQYLNAGAPF